MSNEYLKSWYSPVGPKRFCNFNQYLLSRRVPPEISHYGNTPEWLLTINILRFPFAKRK